MSTQFDIQENTDVPDLFSDRILVAVAAVFQAIIIVGTMLRLFNRFWEPWLLVDWTVFGAAAYANTFYISIYCSVATSQAQGDVLTLYALLIPAPTLALTILTSFSYITAMSLTLISILNLYKPLFKTDRNKWTRLSINILSNAIVVWWIAFITILIVYSVLISKHGLVPVSLVRVPNLLLAFDLFCRLYLLGLALASLWIIRSSSGGWSWTLRGHRGLMRVLPLYSTLMASVILGSVAASLRFASLWKLMTMWLTSFKNADSNDESLVVFAGLLKQVYVWTTLDACVGLLGCCMPDAIAYASSWSRQQAPSTAETVKSKLRIHHHSAKYGKDEESCLWLDDEKTAINSPLDQNSPISIKDFENYRYKGGFTKTPDTTFSSLKSDNSWVTNQHIGHPALVRAGAKSHSNSSSPAISPSSTCFSSDPASEVDSPLASPRASLLSSAEIANNDFTKIIFQKQPLPTVSPVNRDYDYSQSNSRQQKICPVAASDSAPVSPLDAHCASSPLLAQSGVRAPLSKLAVLEKWTAVHKRTDGLPSIQKICASVANSSEKEVHKKDKNKSKISNDSDDENHGHDRNHSNDADDTREEETRCFGTLAEHLDDFLNPERIGPAESYLRNIV